MITTIPKRIKGIKFTFMSPHEIRKVSSTKIITADTYDDDGFPIDMGLMDLHLGVIEPGLRCKTCGRKVDECPGHFGHIDLAMPVIHVGYTKMIKNLLKSTCRVCGRILLPEKTIGEYLDRINEMKKAEIEPFDIVELCGEIIKVGSTSKVCPHCGEDQMNITLDKPTSFREEGHKLTPKEVRSRLERIPKTDLILLGINPDIARPEWTVLTALPVPPVTVRPSITLESGDRSEDDLTHKLVDVLRINQRLQENRDAGAPQLIVEDLWELLQYHVTTYFDNQTSGIPPARHRSGRPLKTLAQRLKGKEGRFRSNLSGKRVNFSARTVISPDPLLSINEVGIPKEAAIELTVPIRVNQYNIDICREMVARGPNIYPGVNYLIRTDGHRIKVTEKNAETLQEKLEPGFIIERHLIDGDIVLFNRQPSLHRMSMMAHEVRVMPFKTFRLNLSVCPPYNADFDGDEMNLHALQSEEARAEAKILMRVQEHILSPRFGGPVMGAIHDHITGIYLFTHGYKLFNYNNVIRLLSIIAIDTAQQISEPAEVDKKTGKQYWTGKQIFSLLLPKDMNMDFRASICQYCKECKREDCENDAFVTIRNGQLLTGTIDERAIGAFKGKILDRITREHGAERGREFLDSVTRLAVGAISQIGFTTGIDDEDIPTMAIKEVGQVLSTASNTVDELVDKYNKGLLEQLPGRSMEETLEVETMKVLSRARDEAGNIAGRHLGLENSAVLMAKSGARGSMLNLTQMAGSVGQQAVRGERISRGYQNRTLPHFKKYDLGAKAKGFVKSSYKGGLTPTEYFFHSMGGREGLVDTAVRTSRSGYMQRRLINALEDLKVMSDGTVRNTANNIIQFDYGDDGIDPSRSVQGNSVDFDKVVTEVLGFETDEERSMGRLSEVEHFGYGEREIEISEPEPEMDDLEEGEDY
ncbi:DNA-directed RNA polymerase subunit A' [[Eubacterium] cellulosolvens]